ncbi:hypothetical protein K1Y72_22445 [Actinomadura sp. PM05-2]|uniref:Mce-associated membrane protein n=1 Tax=Actinomadura parmotrematis TaxID=2864039 RepID=A0ABS7G012_9ACTN|nr:hypothetical protein [Actinomadura parmotrematis]
MVWLGVQYRNVSSDADDREKAAQAARQTGVNLMTLDYKHGQQDLNRILAGLTGEAKDKMSTQAKTLLDQLNKNQATSTVNQVEAGVVSIDDGEAEVMVSLNGTVTNTKVKEGAARPYRYLMDLVKSGDRWLVSKLEVVP